MADLRDPNPTAVLPDPKLGEDPAWKTARYYARQPILTAYGEIFGYELLFRSGWEEAFRGDGDSATRTMLDNTVVFGVEKLTGGPPAFINCTMQPLTTRLVEVLPPKLTVLEILETLEPTPELIRALQSLKARGFQLAVDDFVWKPHLAPLAEIADFIKVDFIQSDWRERHLLLEKLKGLPVKFLAEKIETKEEFDRARSEGFTLFQGYYFCRPTLVANGEIPANKLAELRLLENLQHEEFDLLRISEIVEQDPAIAYRLLRLVNTPMFTYRREVRTVETALMVAGEKTFRRVAILAIASALSGDSIPALLRMALVRARFCELGASICGLDGAEQYLLGLFSLLPAMLRVPMEQAISTIELRQSIREALLGQKSPERALLCWMEASEKGDWQSCDAVQEFFHLDEHGFSQAAAEAAQWADKVLGLPV